MARRQADPSVLKITFGPLSIPELTDHILTVFATEIEASVKKGAPVDTGYLREHWTAEWPIKNHEIVIGTNAFYAAWHTRGTGIYGPYKTPICARGYRTGNPDLPQFLVFKWRKMGNRLMILRCVRGIKPNPYVEQGIEKGCDIAISALQDMIDRGDL